MNAVIRRELPGIRIEVSMASVTRGVGATVDYSVVVFAIRQEAGGTFATIIPGGEAVMPHCLIHALKLELWQSLKPQREQI